MEKLATKEIKALLSEGVTEETLAIIKKDERKSVQNIYRAYEKKQKEIKRVMDLYQIENTLYEKNINLVLGIDEVGRGPLAGPVVVAGVILPKNAFLEKLNDSKKLSEKVREKLYEEIMEIAISTKVVIIDEKTIDRVNIYEATLNGMYEVLYTMDIMPEYVLVDAMKLDKADIPVLSIIKGDSKSASIAAASIVAKVTRDRIMDEYDTIYREYDFKNNKGYGTKKHLDALENYGYTPIHRKSFEPIKSMVAKNGKA